MQATTRRQFIKTTGGVVLGAAALSGMTGLLSSCASNKNAVQTTAATPQWPFPYQPLDVTTVRKLAHQSYYQHA